MLAILVMCTMLARTAVRFDWTTDGLYALRGRRQVRVVVYLQTEAKNSNHSINSKHYRAKPASLLLLLCVLSPFCSVHMHAVPITVILSQWGNPS